MKLFGLRVPFTEQKADLTDITLDEFFRLMGSYGSTNSNIVVNTESALTVTTVLACASRISQALTVPVKIKRRNSDGSRAEVRNHPLYRTLSQRPNSQQTPFEFREMMGFHLAVRGNFYALKSYVNGKIDELTPLIPERVSMELNPDLTVKHYTYKVGNVTTFKFRPDEIWHVKGRSWSMPAGLDVIRVSREAIGLALAAEETQARSQENGLRQTLVFETEKSLDATQLARLSALAKIQYDKTKKSGGVIVVDKGAKMNLLGASGDEAQKVDLRKFQVEQICSAMEIMPIMIGHADKTATYASAEAMFLAHLVHSVRPIHDRVTSSIDRWLLTEDEQDEGYYSQFIEEAFLSPAMKDKAEYRKIALGGGGNPGWLTPNEVRDQDDMPEIPGADKLYTPVNVGPIGPDGVVMTPVAPQKTQEQQNANP